MRYTGSVLYRRFVWFVICAFLFSSTPNIELAVSHLGDLMSRLVVSEALAAEAEGVTDEAQAVAKETAGTAEKTSNEEGKTTDEAEPAPTKASASSDGSGSAIAGSSTPTVEISQFSGAAGITVPIEVPPGRMNMAPRLSLTYNSYLGNGWMGVGWNLDMGSIQRSTKRGVNYSASDFVASIGGSMAELTPRGDWGSGYYGATVEGALSKYYYNSSTGGWEVTSRDGTKYYYGSTSASRQDFDGGTSIFKWCLDRVVDVHGNYMTVTYTKDQGEIYLNSIFYTGNEKTGLAPGNQVRFILEDRTDKPAMFTTNFEVRTAKRLKTIEVYGNDAFQRRFVMNYETSGTSYRSRANSITQYGSDGVSALPPIGLTWQMGGGGFSEVTQNGAPSAVSQCFMGDVNGDGKADFMGASSNGGYTRLHSAISQGNGTYSLAYHDTGIAWDTNTKWFAGDVNGDGKADFMGAQNVGSTRLHSAISRGNGTYVLAYQDVSISWDTNTKWFAGDVNGDGKADFMGAQNVGSTRLHSAISQGNGTYSLAYHDISIAWDTNNKWFAGDVNGDGKADFMGASNNGGYTRLHSAISRGNGRCVHGYSDTGISWKSYTTFLPGDTNGDGKTDMMIIDSQIMGMYPPPYPGREFQTKYYLQFVLNALQSSGDGGYFASSSQKTNERWVSPYLSFPVSGTSYVWMIGDSSGDGTSDLLLMTDRNGWSTSGGKFMTSYLSLASSDTVISLTSPLSSTTTISYTPSSAYRNTLLPSVLQTVSSVTTSDGRGASYTVRHAYEGGLYDYTDREFRGFRKSTSHQMADSGHYESRTETWYH